MATSLAIGGCVHRVSPAPSTAVAEVHQRLADGASQADGACAASSPTIDVVVPFAYAETELTAEGRAGLDTMVDWLNCHPDANLALAVATEPHYRRPEQERELHVVRLAAVMAFLRDAGIADARIHQVSIKEDPATNPADAARLTIRGRGW